jgi:thioredoxin 1
MMAFVTITSADDFKKQVLEATLPVVVDYWAEWCGPCHMLAPTFEELSNTYAGKIIFAKLNVDNVGDVTSQYGVQSIPTTIIFKEGKEVTRLIGAHPKADYVQEFDKVS